MTFEQILDLLGKGGLVAGLLIVVLAFFSDRLPTPGRLKDVVMRAERAETRADKAETQREEAIAGWKAQSEATKELAQLSTQNAQLSTQILDYLRDAFPRGRARD